jgi:hypothetical protein
MKKLLLVLTMLTGTTLFGMNPALAYNDGPWCAIIDLGPGTNVERCDFWSFEACRQEIIGGNRGFCRQSQYWTGGQPPYERVSPRRRQRY